MRERAHWFGVAKIAASRPSLTVRLRAVTLTLITVAAIVFAILNFQQRSRFNLPDDGVVWWDSSAGVVARQVAPRSAAAAAGIEPGDKLVAIDGVPIARSTEATRALMRAGVWTEVQYGVMRQGEPIQVRLVTEPAPKPLAAENYLRLVGLAYLLIGLFIFVRRWNAPRAVQFYVFCLVSFVLYSFHYSGKLSAFDREVYWANVVALLLQPALLVHFALAFPQRLERRWAAIVAVYLVPAALLGLHVLVATGRLGFAPWLGARVMLDRVELLYLGIFFLAAAALFFRSYRRAPAGLVRQQLKLATAGVIAGITPFLLFYVVPYLLGAGPYRWMSLSVLSLALLPVGFGYAIIRYRLMDVDIMFQRGLAYTAATAAVVGVYFALVAAIGVLFHAAWTTGPAGVVLAIVAAAFLFEPLRDWVQERLDRFFYRNRLDYRRALVEFGRTLSTGVRLEPMLASVLDRISQALLVDRAAIFVEDAAEPCRLRLARSIGIGWDGPLDLSFLGTLSGNRRYLFFESADAPEASPEARRTLGQLGLNYFLPCRVQRRTVAVLGLGKTVDGDYLSTDDLDLLFTMAGYVAIAIENSHLYHSLEQKAAQIERLKDFSENIVESLSIGVLTADLDGRIESWNAFLEQRIGVTRAEALGRPLGWVLPAELVGELEACADPARGLRSGEEAGPGGAAQPEADRGVSGIYKFPLQTSAGEIVVNVAVAPLVDKTGGRLGQLILIDDITARIRLEEQIRQSEKLSSLGLLAAGVAHEVNTPLAVISNYVQMLARQFDPDDPRQVLLDKIVKQTFRASEIATNLLNFSRTGSAEFSEVDLNAVVHDTLALLRHPLESARVGVDLRLAGDLPAIVGNANRLQQVFLNLFLNARDAMPSGGRLEILTARSNGHVEVHVSDTGAGIRPEHLNRVFDPFFTTKAPGRGTGLGLAVSYGIIREHSGKVEILSSPGRGTTFRLEFPSARTAPTEVHA
ncbi:MAG TPA: ATP-binding protein [Candidatus Acidoferrales bacterium]|nr:ATP-binding protein [Candidatus Acidoferrales bacterium]